MRGLFISVEGLDGSGKTTQIEAIRDYLIDKGCDTVVLREPGGTRIGEEIRKLVLAPEYSEMDTVAEMLLYAASRAQIVAERVQPLLDEGKTIICDRYIDSSIAYQGYGRGIDIDMVLKVNLMAVRNLLPHMTIFIDTDPVTAVSRRRKATKADRLESEEMEFHKKVYEGFIELCRKYPERIVRVNADMKPEITTTRILEHIDNLIERK
jgi:dTMP kinase